MFRNCFSIITSRRSLFAFFHAGPAEGLQILPCRSNAALVMAHADAASDFRMKQQRPAGHAVGDVGEMEHFSLEF